MSSRTFIYGCNLNKLFSAFGSNQKEFIGMLIERLRQEIEKDMYLSPEEKERHIVEGSSIAFQAISKGVPFVNLCTESDIHCIVIQAVINSLFTLKRTKFNDWKSSVFEDIGDEYSLYLSDAIRKYLYYFQEGRPIFGKMSNVGGRYYGYLSIKEISLLLKELNGFREKKLVLENTIFDEFLDAWTETMEELAYSGSDMWFWIE